MIEGLPSRAETEWHTGCERIGCNRPLKALRPEVLKREGWVGGGGRKGGRETHLCMALDELGGGMASVSVRAREMRERERERELEREREKR